MENDLKQLERVLQKIDLKEPFHIQVPRKNKLVFNKVVPYLFVYRYLGKKDPMLVELVKSEYAFLTVPDPSFDISFWLQPVAEKLAAAFGACLIVEAWTSDNQQEDVQIHIARKNVSSIAQYLGKQLQSEEATSFVEIQTRSKTPGPGYAAPLINLLDKKNSEVMYIGLSIRPSYLYGNDETILPVPLRQFREALARSLSKTFFEFVRINTSSKPTEFKINHRKELLPLVWEIDNRLAKESQRFDFLLLITPINSYEAWQQFKKDNFRKVPVFKYRPIPIDPDVVKHNLYNLPIDDLYDPTIAYLFRDKRKELDYMMTMLSERNKEGFMHGSLLVFGNVSEKLLDKAKAILTITESEPLLITKDEDVIHADEFAAMAQKEIDFLQQQDVRFNTTVRLRDDVYGVMVNQGVLNISKQYSVSRKRAEALIQHEVGTHIVTYYNGKQQPFSLFRLGVPGYEKLQEGLAVLAEYMVDGLTNERLRILAGRVVAVHNMLLGNTFMDTFLLLSEHYRFEKQTAFQMTMRVYRSGGLTKDALYLNGLIELVSYINKGGDLSLLTMGKIREDYIPVVQELMLKGILRPPVLTPRYLLQPYLNRLQNLQKHQGIFQMIK